LELPRASKIILVVCGALVALVVADALFTSPSAKLHRSLSFNLFWSKAVRSLDRSPLQFVDYKVEKGDVLWDLSRRFGVNIDTLYSFNEIQKAHSIFPGQMLRIPLVDGLLYRVTHKDTLDSIASNHNVSKGAIRFYNQLGGDGPITNHMALFLPGATYSLDERLARFGAELMSPLVAGTYRFTSLYGWRVHPVSHAREFHRGIDLGAMSGTTVYAAQSGTVLFATVDFGYGQVIGIQHFRKGLSTRYAHLSRMYVRSGQKVVAQQPIGAVGQTGRATGPHLHFEVARDGVVIDPREVTSFQ
jgi:murein DD-endopeptidase MepM/ murein hydrolase activator NlpD